MIPKNIMNLARGIIVINDGELRVFMEDNNYNWAINLVRYGNPIKVMAELNQFRSRTVKYKTAKGNLSMEIPNLTTLSQNCINISSFYRSRKDSCDKSLKKDYHYSLCIIILLFISRYSFKAIEHEALL